MYLCEDDNQIVSQKRSSHPFERWVSLRKRLCSYGFINKLASAVHLSEVLCHKYINKN